MDGNSSSNMVGKPIQSKAAIARKAGEPLVIEEVIVAPPNPLKVRIKIICTSICHTDVTFWKLETFSWDAKRLHKQVHKHQWINLNYFLFVSSFSEYTVVDIAHVTKIDPAFPANRACLLSCGVSTDVAWKTSKVEAGSTVAIFGLGAIGLAVAEGAMLCGAKRIIGVDVNQDKCEIGIIECGSIKQ